MHTLVPHDLPQQMIALVLKRKQKFKVVKRKGVKITSIISMSYKTIWTYASVQNLI